MTDRNENGKPAVDAGTPKAKDGTEGLKKRIQRHYDITSDQFLKVWGEHIHHGYFKTPEDTAEQAQLNQVMQLAERAGVSAGSRVLDVGCGIGGTARYLARERGCKVTAITNSRRQVEMARELATAEVAKLGSSSSSSSSSPPPPPPTSAPAGKGPDDGFVQYPGADGGAVRVLELDIDEMREELVTARGETFDCVWISEVVFHLDDKQLLFDSASALLGPGGRLVISDTFRTAPDPASAPRRTRKQVASIERNHLCQLGTVEEYAEMAKRAGLRPRGEPLEITKNVAKTW
ncbi:putative secondary metabolism biosynthetic enzyme [Diaporthe eres]